MLHKIRSKILKRPSLRGFIQEQQHVAAMSFGKLYTYDVSANTLRSPMCTAGIKLTATQGNPRSTAIRAVAKANNLELEIVPTEPAKGLPTEYLKLNPLGKIPSFEGVDGYFLSEAIAIAIYRMCRNFHKICPRRIPSYDEMFSVYSYPCLNCTVEIIYSHSDVKLSEPYRSCPPPATEADKISKLPRRMRRPHYWEKPSKTTLRS